MGNSDLRRFVNDPALLNKNTLEEIKSLTEVFPYFQTAWILYLKNLKVINHPKFKSELQRVAIRISDRRKLYRFLYPEKGNSDFILNSLSKVSTSGIGEYSLRSFEESIENPRKSKNNLIDSFIATQPSIKLNTGEDVSSSVVAVSQKSDEANDELLTETLANIFMSQKKYDKAIDAFEKLSLKFPEKNSYFAARIDEIFY